MTTISTSEPVAARPIYASLFVQVLAALLLGIFLGMAAPNFAISLKIFSDAFLKLISMIVAPIVFCVVVHGIAAPEISRRSVASVSRHWCISRA